MGEVQTQEFEGRHAGGSGYGCCLSPSELQDRTGQWRALSALGLIDVTEQSGDLSLRFKPGPEMEVLLRALVRQETQCCSALVFEISAGPGELTLRISGEWRETPWAEAVSAGAPAGSPGIQEIVRRRYAAAARSMSGIRPGGESDPAIGGESQCGCGSGCGCGAAVDPADVQTLGTVRGVSLGSGNAVRAADLKEGEVVLDLGSGAGIDVLIAARRVGPQGRVYGLDMTDEMLELARRNQISAGVDNVTFVKGRIEQIPLPEASVDVVISNCVINLSPRKQEVFAEIMRVLRPGGRLAVSDVVADFPSTAGVHPDPDAWAACIAGALTRQEYRGGLEMAEFQNITIEEGQGVQPGYSSVILRASKAFGS